jgi:heme-degrading monooxygenase HmoA
MRLATRRPTVWACGPAPWHTGYYEVKTWWRSFEDFVAATQSPDFAEAHSSRPPKEMFAGPKVFEVTRSSPAGT